MVKHEAKFIMNQTYVDQKAYEWEGSYTYSLIVEGFLHLQVDIISLPISISRREIDGYKVPLAYITNFLPVLYESKNILPVKRNAMGKNVPLTWKSKVHFLIRFLTLC
jgi:hypothetical protein